MQELRERQKAILAAVIESYIRTGEPVGSKAVMQLLGSAVSSATIRNDMAILSAEGYLDQPHTSAGRIPTAKAFRLYIDALMPRRALEEERRALINKRLRHAAGDPERLMAEATQILSETTGCGTSKSGVFADVGSYRDGCGDDVVRCASQSPVPRGGGGE